MGSVFQLFSQTEIEKPLVSNTSAKIAANDILASSVWLEIAIRELSRNFEALNPIIDALDDPEARNSFRQSLRLNREILTNAMLELSRQRSTLHELQIKATVEKLG